MPWRVQLPLDTKWQQIRLPLSTWFPWDKTDRPHGQYSGKTSPGVYLLLASGRVAARCSSLHWCQSVMCPFHYTSEQS